MPGYWAPRYFARVYFAGRYFPPPVAGGIVAAIEVVLEPAAAAETTRDAVAAAAEVVLEPAATAETARAIEAAAVEVDVAAAASLTANRDFAGAAEVVLDAEAAISTFVFRFNPRPRVWIHDGETLALLGELTKVSSINRSYGLLDHVRAAEFDIGWSDADAALTDEAVAHVVRIESSEYPLPWVGRIVERVANHGDRSWTVHADSYEAILAERVLDTAFATPAGVASALARILGQINGANPTGIGLGHIDGGTAPPMALANMLGIEAVERLAENAGMEWWLSSRLEGGVLQPLLNLAVERGASYFDTVVLRQPGNFEITSSKGNGRARAYAQTVVGGQASVIQAFSERERSVVTADGQFRRDDAAVRVLVAEALRVTRHGHVLAGETSFRAPTQRNERLVVREELKEPGITGDVAQRLWRRERSAARSVTGFVVPDVEGQPATSWRYLGPGVVVHVVSRDAFGVGYDGPAVITGVQPVEHQRRMDLVLEVG